MRLPNEALWAMVAGAVGLLFALVTSRRVLSKDRGNDRMKEIQDNISLGAMAFLRREYRVLSIFVLAVAVVLAVGLSADDIAGLGWKTAVAFVVGALCSSLCGFGGMKIATAANARTTQAATRSFNEALNVAFPGGVVMGMLVMSLGVLGLTALFYVFDGMEGDLTHAGTILAGFSMGASSIALFGVIVCGSMRTRRPPPPSGKSSSAPVRICTTVAAVFRSKNGRMHSTELSASLPGIRIASGVRTIRPRSWVMWVASFAGRNDMSTSARGQSHPVLIPSFAIRTRTLVSSCTRSGETYRTEYGPYVAVVWSPRTCATASPVNAGHSANTTSNARAIVSGSGVFGTCSTMSGTTGPVPLPSPVSPP